MRKLRDLKVPVSAVFAFDAVDSDANLGWPFVTFAGRQAGPYPDPAASPAPCTDWASKSSTISRPISTSTDRTTRSQRCTGSWSSGRTDGSTSTPDFQVAWLDYTDPDAVLWWGASWRRALSDLGYDGGMLDLGELIPRRRRARRRHERSA